MAQSREIDPRDFNPPVGQAEWIAPDVRRLLAPNPSPMTFRGTNTYIVGRGHVAVIDPGPLDGAHRAALEHALEGERISHILVTHAHLDHSPLAADLSRRHAAPVLAFGAATAGRSPEMERLAASGQMRGGEGVDGAFAPTRTLVDGETVTGDGWQIIALHTPGHMSNHMCFEFGDMVFSGDHVMGWSTSLVSPPDGDLGAFMASCAALRGRSHRVYLPGHGAAIDDPASRLDALMAHRRMREAQILAVLETGPGDAAGIAARLYTGLAPALLPAACRNVLAHLIELTRLGHVVPDPDLRHDARFRLRPKNSNFPLDGP